MKKPTKTGLDRFSEAGKFTPRKESSFLERGSLIRGASSSETVTLSGRTDEFSSDIDRLANMLGLTGKVLDLEIEQAKEDVRRAIRQLTFSGSVEEGINNYKLTLERKISTNRGVAAFHWELYGHLRFLFSDKSPEDLRAAARAYKNSLRLDHKKTRSAFLLVEVSKQLRRIEDHGAPHQIPLPQEEKRAIENQPYGKLVCIEQMSEKVQDAIAKGEHVGEFIQRELIGPSEKTLDFIAGELGVYWTSISYVRNGRYKLSPEMAAKLSHYFKKYTTQELLTIQAVHDAKKADQDFLASLHKKDEPTPV